MKMRQVPGEYSIGRYEPNTDFKPLFSRSFCSITRTPDEVTIVCESDLLPQGFAKREDGWACLQVEGIMDFNLTGVLSKIAGTLAGAEVSIFAISTFDTDYVLVKAATLEKARHALTENGIALR
ncbi:MAG: ACT domain-containing protein [Bdellovibrionales bacterium]|nr:ACT domain-containing protein [Bdellovibrionales bacterium]